MTDNNKYPKRKRQRARHWSYYWQGAYFITIVTQYRTSLFGEVKHGRMMLNDAGGMLNYWWNRLVTKFNIVLDDYIVMPNHFHGIIVIEHDLNDSVSDMMQWFKTMTTNAYIHGVKEENWQPFEAKLWQKSFHDTIIRDQQAWDTIKQYIQENPIKWQEDRFYIPRD